MDIFVQEFCFLYLQLVFVFVGVALFAVCEVVVLVFCWFASKKEKNSLGSLLPNVFFAEKC